MFCEDIILVVSEYIGSIKDLLSWRSTCKQLYTRIYKAYFICDRFIDGIIPTKLDFSNGPFDNHTLLRIASVGNYIDTLICHHKIQNEHLGLMPNLKHLDCNCNRLITDTGISSLTKLVSLECGYADITDESLCHLTNLEYLDCGYDSYFERIGDLPKLKTLRCSYSDVRYIQKVPDL